MTGVCYFCGARMVLRKSSLLPNPDAAKHLDECWVYQMLHKRTSGQFGSYVCEEHQSAGGRQ